jgi:PhoPQ-activated pathogenicity-related protein
VHADPIPTDQLTTSTAVLYIDGGSNSSSPTTLDPTVLQMAASSGAIVIDLGQVPNEPISFTDETFSRSEDAIIAYTWNKYLLTGDERWPARLPMTKAAVRAMDAATAFLASADRGGIQVKNFIVSGASKRGWTTWAGSAHPRWTRCSISKIPTATASGSPCPSTS